MIYRRYLMAATALAVLVTTACNETATNAGSGLSGPRASASGGTSVAQPDIQLNGSSSTNSPAAGATYSYTFQAKNSGTAVAPGVAFTTVLPAELPPASFQRATQGDGTPCAVSVAGQVSISCGLGDMAVGVQKTVTIVVMAPTTSGTYSVSASAYESDVATNSLADKNLADNTKAISVSVSGGIAPLAGVLSYSNFGPTDSVPNFIGWGLVGLLTTPAGFFTDVTERFSPTVSGSLSSIRLAVEQTGTGGSGSYTVNLYADNATPPDTSVCTGDACAGTTIGILVGTFQGKATKHVFGATTAPLSVISLASGPRLQAGVNYWIRVVPSAQTRMTWYLNPLGVVGESFYEDPYPPQSYSMDAGGSQGAFQIRVLP